MKDKKIYKVKQASRIKSEKAQVYGEELERIAKENGNRLESEMVVKEAKKKGSIFHDYFEWDDSIAAKKWRIEQARYLIRHMQVIVTYKDEERAIRQFVSLNIKNGDEEPRRKFIPAEIVAKDEALREIAIHEAMDEFIAIQFKYKEIQELGAIFSAIEETQLKLKERKNITLQ